MKLMTCHSFYNMNNFEVIVVVGGSGVVTDTFCTIADYLDNTILSTQT